MKKAFSWKSNKSSIRIPPEDRHNSNYYFSKGLFQDCIGEDVAAKKNVQHALALNPKFLEAERVLRSMDQKEKRGKEKTDIFRGDLSTVVGNLFRSKNKESKRPLPSIFIYFLKSSFDENSFVRGRFHPSFRAVVGPSRFLPFLFGRYSWEKSFRVPREPL